jgi:hypothetical protein
MPILNVTTKSSEVVWTSPDGQRTIYKLTLDYEGKPVAAQTFSKEIATEGWSGDVETYEREGKAGRPSQTFVKQPPKEGGTYGGGTQSGSQQTSQGSGGGRFQPKDEKAIKAMWSIGQAVQLYSTNPDAKNAAKVIEHVEVIAQELFAMVDRVKASENAPEAATNALDLEPTTMPLDEASPVTDEEMATINEIFDKKKE